MTTTLTRREETAHPRSNTRPAPLSRWSAWRARVRETNDRIARNEASVSSRLDALSGLVSA